MKNNSQTQTSPKDNKAKKTYQTPEFFFYGDVREITQNVANNSQVLDGGGGSMQKTQ